MIELNKDTFAKSLRAFLRHMKENGNGVRFTSFDHPFLVDNEIAYKLDAQAKARKILSFSKWPSWRSKRGRILRAMRDACDPSVSNNLLEHQYGESGGSYSALYRLIPDDIRAFEALALDLHAKIYEPDSVIAEAFDTFAEFLREKHLGCKWDFMAYFLFLMRPDRFFPIRSTHFENVLRFYGVECEIAGFVSWERCKLILDVAELVKEELRLYGTPSAIQVQSFMWVASYLLESLNGAVDDTPIDFDEERAEAEPYHEELGNIITTEPENWERAASSWIVRRKS